MIDTKLPANPSNLIRLVKEYATPETLAEIAREWDTCPPGKRLELVMDAWATYEQEAMVVKIISTDTWGLIEETQKPDNEEYLSLWNGSIIKHWFE